MVTANMNLLFFASAVIVVGYGVKLLLLVELQLMISMLAVWMAMFMNRPMKTATTIIEQIPPEAVL
jgi:hypothetical protein